MAVATTLSYTFTDQLGTPLLQTDSSGTIVWRAEHEPYGNVYLMRKGARTDQPLRLPGQDLAMTWEGSEENYNVFRWYRGGWGRYTQGDPVRRYRAGDDAAYSYGSVNPVYFYDPKGLFVVSHTCKACDALDPKAKNLSEYIIPETQAFCKNKLSGIQDVALRNCIKESCAHGTVECQNCDDPAEAGESKHTGGFVGQAFHKFFPSRTAIVCLGFNLNYKGEAGNTVIHEWAHGCGYDADQDLPGIPGIPR